MKRLEVIVRFDKAISVMDAINEVGVGGMTVVTALGQGAGNSPLVGPVYSRQYIITIVDDSKVDKLKAAIVKAASSKSEGGYDLRRYIETLEDYMRNSGMKSDHRVEGNLHHFIIQHEMGIQWSVFTELLLRRVFAEFKTDKGLKFQTTESTVIATIPLGADFDEHDY